MATITNSNQTSNHIESSDDEWDDNWDEATTFIGPIGGPMPEPVFEPVKSAPTTLKSITPDAPIKSAPQSITLSETVAQTVANAYRNPKIDTPVQKVISNKILGDKQIPYEISLVPGRKLPLLNLLHKAAQVYSIFGKTDPIPEYHKMVANLTLRIKTHRERIVVLQKMLDTRLTPEEQVAQLEVRKMKPIVEYKELYALIEPESILGCKPDDPRIKKCTTTSTVEEIIEEFYIQGIELIGIEQQLEGYKNPPTVSPDFAKLVNIKAAYKILVDRNHAKKAFTLHAEICAALSLKV
jgi:hypothetical protein